MRKILLVNGAVGSGKDELTNRLLIEYNIDRSVKLAFADELKRIINKLYDVPLNLLNGTQKDKEQLTTISKNKIKVDGFDYKNEYFTVRELMCHVGDKLKELDLYCWCRPVASFIEKCRSEPGNNVGWWKNIQYFFVSDLRFPFEYEYLKNNCKEAEIKTIKLLRSSGQQNKHNSETSLKEFKFDNIIDNRNLSKAETFAEFMKLYGEWLND